MNKADRDALISDLNYFEGVIQALTVGLFNASSASNLVALQKVTNDKINELKLKLAEGEHDGSSTQSTAAG